MSTQMVPEIYQPDAMVGEVKLWRAPDAIVAEAKQAADALRRIIDGSDNKPVKFGDKEHLKHEHWEILGHFFGYCTKVVSTEPVTIEIDGETVRGFLAAAELLNERTGMVVGRAEAMCLDNEEMWGEVAEYEWQETYTRDNKPAGKQRVKVGTKAKPFFQLRSMAQTRASAKAFRHKLAWVAVLAGYSPTPESDMTGNERPAKPAADSLPNELKKKNVRSAATPSTAAVGTGVPASVPPPITPDPFQRRPAPRTAQPINERQARRFYALWKSAGKTRALVIDYLQETFGIDDDRQIPANRYEEACAWAQKEGF